MKADKKQAMYIKREFFTKTHELSVSTRKVFYRHIISLREASKTVWLTTILLILAEKGIRKKRR